MVTLTNGGSYSISQLLAGSGQDAKGRNVKFEQEKDTNVPVYTSKRKDGSVYSFTLPENAMATVTVQEKSDLKAQRKAGFPVPKDEAGKLDKEIKEEELKSKAAAKAAAKGISQEEAEREVIKEDKEAEAEKEGASEETTEEKPTFGRRAR